MAQWLVAAQVYTLGGSALDTTLNTLATVFLLEIDDLLYHSLVDNVYKRHARKHGSFAIRSFDHWLIQMKRIAMLLVCTAWMVVQVSTAEPNFVATSISTFYLIFCIIGFVDAMRDPSDGRRVISACVGCSGGPRPAPEPANRSGGPGRVASDSLRRPATWCTSKRISRRVVAAIIFVLLAAVTRGLAIIILVEVTEFDVQTGFDDDQ